MGGISAGLTTHEEQSSLETCDRPDAWLCELTLQETATESVSTRAVSATSTPLELASPAGPIATAVADNVCGVQTSPDSGPISGVAAPVEALPRLHVRASDQGFLPIQADHYFMLLDWTGANSARTSAGRFQSTWPRSWSGWASMHRIGWKRCVASVGCSSRRRGDRACLSMPRHAARGAGSRARRRPEWPFCRPPALDAKTSTDISNTRSLEELSGRLRAQPVAPGSR